MPPVPPTYDSDTSALLDSARRLEKDLVNFQIPRLRDCEGPLPIQQTLWAEVRDDIDNLSRHIQDLDILVDDQRGDHNKRTLKAFVDELTLSLDGLRKDSRAALLASKKVIDSQSTTKREELLQSAAATQRQSANEKTTEDVLMKKNQDLTDALQRTADAMQKELSRSVLTIQTLESSTQTLRSTSSTHDMLTTGLDTSKRLITALEKADWLDRMIMLFGFACFTLTVLFILKQRVFDRGMKIAFWWTRFVPDFGGDEALLKMEEGSGIVETVVATATSVLGSALEASSVISSTFSAALGSETQPSMDEL